MSYHQRSRLWRGFIVVALLLGMIGMAGAPSAALPPIVEAAPDHDRHTPLDVTVSMPEMPAINTTAEATIVVTSSRPAAGVHVDLVGSSGLRIDGERAFVIDLDAGESRTLVTSVTPEVAGNHSIAANVSLDLGGGNVWGDSDAVYFASGDGTSARSFAFAGDPMSGAASPGPGNTMELEAESFPDGSMADFARSNVVDGPIDSGEPGSQDATAYTDTLSAPRAELTIYGNAGMYDRQGVWTSPVLLVELLSANGNSLATTYSTYGGRFVFKVDNPGQFHIRVWAYYRHDSMTIGAIRVVGSGLETPSPFSVSGWHYITPLMGPVPNGEFNAGSWGPAVDWEGRRAWWIYQDLVDAFAYTWNKVPPGVPAGARQPDGVTVEWEPGSVDGTYYHRPERRIHLKDIDANSGHTVLHEYGHAVMHNVYGGYLPINDCPRPHYVEKVGGNNCSWLEGWANFFALAVKNDPVYTWGCALPCVPPSVNFETHARGDYWDMGPYVEGNVAALLWDFIDSAQDGHDKTNAGITPFWKIWDVVYTYNHGDFTDFWYTWYTRVNLTNSMATLYQNTIDWGWQNCADHTFEPDDDPTKLQVYAHLDDAPYQRVLCTDHDVDYFMFEAIAGRSYTIETFNLGTARDGTIADTTMVLSSLSDQGWIDLAFDDNSGSQHLGSRITLTATTDGWHYVAIRHVYYLGDFFYRYSIDFTLNP